MYPLITQPHPALRQPCRDVGARLAADPWRWVAMAEALEQTMHRYHAVGIAAPQVAMRSRLAVLWDGTVLIDPIIIDRHGEQTSTEGCLSLPGEQWTVTRPATVTVAFTDLAGLRHERRYRGFEATVIEHELDHLDGILLDTRATR